MTERLQAIKNRLEDMGKKVEHDLCEENRVKLGYGLH